VREADKEQSVAPEDGALNQLDRHVIGVSATTVIISRPMSQDVQYLPATRRSALVFDLNALPAVAKPAIFQLQAITRERARGPTAARRAQLERAEGHKPERE
jgi:hypothetical protein